MAVATTGFDKTRALLDLKVKPYYETLREAIDIFSERYDFISVNTIGETIMRRNIYMISLGDESAEKEIFYVGAHHATEWITTLILLKFINEYCEYYKSNSKVFGINMHKLFRDVCIRIVPCLNADGVELHLSGADESCPLYERQLRQSGGDFSEWQANSRGVDLNHNYDAGFYEYKLLEATRGINAGPTRYSGPTPESEPETGAVANYLRFNEKIKMVLTLHSQGEVIYYTTDGKCPENAFTVAKQLEFLSGYTLSEPKGLASYGGLTDWCIKELGLPSFTIEVGKGKNPLPINDFCGIYTGIRRMLFSAPLLV